MAIYIDIIILSYAKTYKEQRITLGCVESLLASENANDVVFETLVIESNKKLKPYQYPGTQTIYPESEFGYNRYLNIGIKLTSSPYLCLCNNDLVFHKNWATEILKVFKESPRILSANPYCPKFSYNERIVNGDNVILRDETLDINGVLTGWCIFVRRAVFKITGLLDEQFTFWYADNDYDMTLRKYGVKHALIKSSLVTHLACQSHDLLMGKKDELTTGQRIVFDNKWHRNLVLMRLVKKIKSLF